ncbi:MAG TPA: amidase [Candidatus Eisenbacteria bacterium]|nr:amidase [Candidatus Eisenbacteria bacterium]
MKLEAELAFASIAEIGKLFRSRKLSPVELTKSLLDRIEQLNPRINAYLAVNPELALYHAAAAESSLCTRSRSKSSQDLGPLHGIPISLKDNLYTADFRTTGGSQILRDFQPLHDAAVVISLKAAGAVILGKTNLHEFAYGVTSTNPHYGAVRNPWSLDRIPGGSSGGSAAALAAGLCYGSIGTDTGGSIRIPASLCGIVGLKPGFGRVSAEGAIPLSTTLDFAGPMARTVADVAVLAGTIAVRGKNKEPRPLRAPSAGGRRPRIGVLKHFFLEIVSPEVEQAFESALDRLRKKGARLKQVTLPYLQESEWAGNIIAWAEATNFHQQAGWYPHRAAEYGEDVRTRLEMGEKVRAVEYLKARELREKFMAGFHLALLENEVDVVVAPTTPITAPKIGEETILIAGAEHNARALLLRNNRPANLAGIPAISVPCGLTLHGLPAALQLMAGLTDEPLLLEIAALFEQAMPLHVRPHLASID